MPKEKFPSIYEALKSNILSNAYSDTNMLPPESHLVDEFQCSRNTIRRAIAQLNSDGLVHSSKGKGVIILENPSNSCYHTSGSFNKMELHGLQAFTDNQAAKIITSVISFKRMEINEPLSQKTGFKIGSDVFYLHRIRFINDTAITHDISYFLCDIVRDLTIEIAQTSIYDYIYHTLGLKIISSRRKFSIEKATTIDGELLPLNDYNCVGVITKNTYIEDGRMFEFTESRHTPENFTFIEYVRNS